VTLARWLDERSTAVPPRLAARLDEALSRDRSVRASETPKVCLDAADTMLRDLLARPSAGRDVALDLLAVDALVTYAFEAAATDPSTLRDRAIEAAARFAALAHD
jgi:hypothetical protein